MTQINALISGRKTDGTLQAIKTDSKGSLDIFLQDQATPSHNFYAKRQLGLTTLASNSTANTKTITLTDGHGFTSGEFISILESSYVYQAKVTNVNVNILTLSSPLNYNYTTSAIIRRTTVDMNVDGASSPVTFNITPISGQVWDITSIVFLLEDDTQMDTAKFGGITALTYGIVLRKKLNGTYNNLFNIRTNGEFVLHSGITEYQTKAPSGTYGLTSKHVFGGQSNFGVVIRLDGSKGEELQILIQDNLTDLSKFNATVQLHEVLD